MIIPDLHGFQLPIDVIVKTKTKVREYLIKFKNYIMGQAKSRMSTTATKFVPASQAPMSEETLSNKVALGAGCFWGTEKYIRKDFQKKFPNSIKDCVVGFMSPETKPKYSNPTYEQVCSGASGHIEVLYVELNEPEKHFEELIRFFFQFHDPTTKNRQGNDTGFQYASWIFCDDTKQIAIANKVRDELQLAMDHGAVTCYNNSKITTQITPLTSFTKASSNHQKYLEIHPNGYCNHRIRLQQWVSPVSEE